MKLKLDDAGHAVLQEGNPVYIDDDGKERAQDINANLATINRVIGESRTLKEKLQAAEAKLQGFDGIDPAAAREAIDKIGNIDAKKLIDSGEVDRVKADISKLWEGKLTALQQELAAERETVSREMVNNAFARSKFATDKLTPAGVDLIQARYGNQLKVENGKLIPLSAAGDPLQSRSRIGEVADFEEAIEAFVESYPHKEHILKGGNQSGGGSRPGNAKMNGPKTMARSQFDSLSPMEQASKMREGFTLTESAA